MCVGSARCRQESRNFWGRLVSGVQSRLKAKPAARNSAILSCRSSALCALRSEQGGARHGRSGNCPLLQELQSLYFTVLLMQMAEQNGKMVCPKCGVTSRYHFADLQKRAA